MTKKQKTKKQDLKSVYKAAAEAKPETAALVAVAVKDKAVPVEVQLAKLEQFIRQLHTIERRGESDAVKAAICQGLALNFAKPMLKGGFLQWSAERFPEISATQQHYYRKIAADFQEHASGKLKLPDYRDHSGATAMIAKFGGSREADRLMEDYIGDRSISEILYGIGARPQQQRGGFLPDVTEAANFIKEQRPELEGVKTTEWPAEAIKQFYKWQAKSINPADQTKLNYDAAKSSFDHALSKIAELINGSTPKYQRLSSSECSEIAKQLRAFADIVSRSAKKSEAKK